MEILVIVRVEVGIDLQIPRKKVCQIIRKVTVNLQDIWRESLHGIWRMFHLPEEGKCAVRRSSRDDFELYRPGPRRNRWRQGRILNPTDHAKYRAKKYVR